MKGFKIYKNLDRYLKLFLIEFRFHYLKESSFKDRNGKSLLESAGTIYRNSTTFYRFFIKNYTFPISRKSVEINTSATLRLLR